MLCIIEGNILNNGSKPFHIQRNFTILDPVSNYVAEYASEILMSGVGEEGAAICKHADERWEGSKVCKDLKLFFHAVPVIAEPPSGTKLDLSLYAFSLPAAHKCAERVVVFWIEGVEDRLRDLVGF